MTLDLRGLNPAPVTPFTTDGDIDFDAIQRLGSWLGSIDGVKSLTVLGHAGEGTFLTVDEQIAVIGAFGDSVDGQHPDHRRHHRRGNKVAALEAKRAVDAGASAGLVYPSHGWLRSDIRTARRRPATRRSTRPAGCRSSCSSTPTTPRPATTSTPSQDRRQEGVFATKNGVRNMKRWYTEIPALRAAVPRAADPLVPRRVPAADDVRRRRPARRLRQHRPELLVELIAAGKAQDYPAAHALHERLLPVTKNVYHRGSHMEGTVALKWGLVHRGILDHATVRPPLLPLADGAEAEIAAAFASAGLDKVTVSA